MLDINNKNNFEQLPPLKQKCDVVNGTVKHQQQQSTIKLQGKYNDLIKTSTTAATSTGATKHYSGNSVRNHHHNSSSNIKNKVAGINPVSVANQQFFLIQAYKDQNFLKKECDLARSQVVRLEAKERAKSVSTNSKELSGSRYSRFEKANGKEASSIAYNDDSYNNNNHNSRYSGNNKVNTTNATGRKTETKPLQTTTTAAATTNGRRFSYSNNTGPSHSGNVIANGGGLGNSNALPKINKFNCCNPPATQALAGQQRSVATFVRPTITTISLATTTNSSNKFLKQPSATTKTETANKYKYNNNNNNSNNNMQKHQQHPQQQRAELNDDDGDIKYIDSDEPPPVATYEQKQSGNSMSCQQRCCGGEHQQQKHAPTGKLKARPKSTIICSTNSQQQHNQIFEKVNSYRYGGGSGGGGSTYTITAATDLNPQLSATANAALAERRRELKKTIDSNSIKASIEKFNSLSEQKRLPYATSNSNNTAAGAATTAVAKNALRQHHHHHLNHNIAAAGNSGSASNINIQHHRYSSDFSDTYNARLPSSVIGGGSLTRTATRNVNATTSIVNKVVTNLYTAASASTSASTSPVTIKATRNLNALSNQSSESSSPTHVSSSSSSPVQKPTSATLLQLRSGIGSVSERLKDNNNSNVAAAVATTTNNTSSKTCTNLQVTPSVAAAVAASIESNDNKLSNNLCDINDSARSSSSLRSPLPPPSPTASRYWDRESNRTSSSTRTDDHNDSKPLDEKSEGLCGLRNIGNTCFMNSVIQCLSHTSELTKFLRTQNGVKSSSSRDQQILYEFAKLIREMWTPSVHSVTPMELKRAFSTKHRMYSDYNQQDAQEFLRFFLDSLHCALNSGVKGGEPLKIDDNLSDNKKADLTWDWYTRHENSLIRDLFVGQLKSTLKCTTCGNTSVTFDPFWDLSVSLPSLSRCKLDACLDLFIREEVLDGDEMPTCSKCKTRRKCTKSFSIQRFPKYLVIHLKRFSETRWSKLSNIVEFPTGERELNMAPYGANHSSSVHYSLYGISNHMGSTAGGHYVALCKHPISKKWHEFNDNIVSDDLSENHLVSSSAYILFYERA